MTSGRHFDPPVAPGVIRCRIKCKNECDIFNGFAFPKELEDLVSHCMFHHRKEAVVNGIFRHDPVECDGWEVLHGIARFGTQVAYSVRDGNMAAMRLGIVRGYDAFTRYNKPGVKLKIEITGSSDFGVVIGKVITVEHLERIVVLREPEPSVPSALHTVRARGIDR